MVTHNGDLCIFGVEAQFMQRAEDSICFLCEGHPVQLTTLKLLTAKCDWMQVTFCFSFVPGSTDFLRQTGEALGVCDLCVRRLRQCRPPSLASELLPKPPWMHP